MSEKLAITIRKVAGQQVEVVENCPIKKEHVNMNCAHCKYLGIIDDGFVRCRYKEISAREGKSYETYIGDISFKRSYIHI